MKLQKLGNKSSVIITNKFEILFFNLHTLLSIEVPDLCISIADIVVEGTMSQIFYVGPSSLFIKCRKKYSENKLKTCPFFDIKLKLRLKT